MTGLRAKAASATALGLATLVLVAGCATVENDSGGTTVAESMSIATPAAPEATTDASDSEPSDADSAAFDVVQAGLGKWNAAAEPFVIGYMDESVDAETWLAEAEYQLAEMRDALQGLGAAANLAQDPYLGDWMTDLAGNYAAKLAAVEALADAVADGSEEGQYAAQEDLRTAANDSKAIIRDFPAAVGMTEDERAEFFRLLGEAVIDRMNQ